jgi:iron complex transport system substrate-binding protein
MAHKVPKRIVSFAFFITEILSYLGFGEQTATLKEYCEDVPPEPDRQRPEYWFTMAMQRIHSLKADLVITTSVAQQDLHKRIREAGYQTLHLDPRSIREVEDSYIQIGKVTGSLEPAKRLSQDFAGGLTALRDKVPGNSYRPKLYCEDWNAPPTAAGAWYTELMAQIGAHYFPMLSREISRPVKIQEILKFDPEIMVFVIRGSGLDFNPNEALKRIGWQKINAVRKRRIYCVDQTLLNRPGPRLIEGAKLVQAILGENYWGWPLNNSPLVRKIVD